MVKYITGAELLRKLVSLESQVATLEGGKFGYSAPGSFAGMAASQRVLALHQRVSALEGSAAPAIPKRWYQGRSPQVNLDALQLRIIALSVPPSPDKPVDPDYGIPEFPDQNMSLTRYADPVESFGHGTITVQPITYPQTIFTAVLTQSPITPNNWSARQIVSVTAGPGPLGQVRCTFQASAAKDFRINNASIGVSVMKDKNDVPDNGATQGTPVLLFPGNVYVPAGTKLTSNWASLPFSKDQLLVVIIDHNTDTGNPMAVTGLGGFPNGTRQGYQMSKTSYNSKLPLTTGNDGQIWGLTQIEVQ